MLKITTIITVIYYCYLTYRNRLLHEVSADSADCVDIDRVCMHVYTVLFIRRKLSVCHAHIPAGEAAAT